MISTDNILIVDDNPNNLQVLVGILQGKGFRVRPALSGEMALRAVASQLPDLILLDVRMPGMDGYETCRRLKAADDTRDIPVLGYETKTIAVFSQQSSPTLGCPSPPPFHDILKTSLQIRYLQTFYLCAQCDGISSPN